MMLKEQLGWKGIVWLRNLGRGDEELSIPYISPNINVGPNIRMNIF